jgi:hypothetical protein
MLHQAVELSQEEIQFIQACVLTMVRQAQAKMPERDAIRTTTAAAETISRLNHGSIDARDVDFICLAIKKTIDSLPKNNMLKQAVRDMVRRRGEELQQKFTRALHGTLPHIWNDGERKDDVSETPSSAVQVQ